MERKLSIALEERMGYIWITLPDSIHMDNYRQIETDILSHLTGKGDRVVLDLSATQNLFSSGLGLIIRLRKFVGSGKGYICVVNVSHKIRDLLESVHLEKVIPIYATDVEFEISQDDIWKQRLLEDGLRFIFLTQLENGICRINLSGYMTATQDLSEISRFLPIESVSSYVFDLTGLDIVDSYGTRVLRELFIRISRKSGRCIAYGANELVTELLKVDEFAAMISFHENERDALAMAQKQK